MVTIRPPAASSVTVSSIKSSFGMAAFQTMLGTRWDGWEYGGRGRGGGYGRVWECVAGENTDRKRWVLGTMGALRGKWWWHACASIELVT